MWRKDSRVLGGGDEAARTTEDGGEPFCNEGGVGNIMLCCDIGRRESGGGYQRESRRVEDVHR